MNYNKKKLTSEETKAWMIISNKYNDKSSYDEIVDSLYHYMFSIVNGYQFDVGMFADEIENLIGIRKRTDIINYILKNYS